MDIKTETSAGGIVFKRTSHGMTWLITQHSQHKGWVFPKGLVGDTEKNESTDTAALREVQEEGGVKAKIISPLPKPIHYNYKFKETFIEKTVYYFLMEYVSGDPKDHDHEMMDAKFVSEEEVKNTLTYQTDKEAFESALILLGAGEGN